MGVKLGYVITIAQRKGGAGKTTLACQLTAALTAQGNRVAVIDADEQGSFLNWAQRRLDAIHDDNLANVEMASGYALSSALRRAKNSVDITVVDTPPVIDHSVRTAIRRADLVLTPLQLSPLDLEATIPTARMIGDFGARALFVINRAPPRARIADRIRAEIGRQGLPVAHTELGARAAFSESLANGRGVVESAPSSRAASEVRGLVAEVMRNIQTEQKAA